MRRPGANNPRPRDSLRRGHLLSLRRYKSRDPIWLEAAPVLAFRRNDDGSLTVAEFTHVLRGGVIGGKVNLFVRDTGGTEGSLRGNALNAILETVDNGSQGLSCLFHYET